MEDDFYQDYGVEDKEPEDKKSKKKKNKKEKKVKEKHVSKSEKEDFSYNDYYDENNNKSVDEEESSEGSNKILFIILGILLVVLAVLLVIKYLPDIKDKFGSDEKVTLTKTQYTLSNGESTTISYKSKYNNLTWESDNTNVCTVEGNKVTAVGNGSCVITVSGIDENGSNFSYNIYITVSDNSSGPENPSGDLSLDIKSNGSDGWNTSDVSITVKATGYTRLVYVVNCNGTCDYKNVSNGLITISTEGDNKVTVIASKGEREIKKEVAAKIDKSKPTCSLSASNSSITATVNDSVSGISKKGFNKDYSDNSTTKNVSSVGTYTYYVKDNAGNTNTCSINVSGSTQYRTASCIRGKTCTAAGCSEYDDTKWTDATDTEGICTGRTSDITSGDIRCTNCSSSGCKFQTTVCKTGKRSIEKCGCDSWSEFGEWTTEAARESNYLRVETRIVIK